MAKIKLTFEKEYEDYLNFCEKLNFTPKTMKTTQKPEQLFLKEIKTLINNLLIENPNYKNNYYFQESDASNTLKLLKDTKERASYVLERIKQIEHLVLIK